MIRSESMGASCFGLEGLFQARSLFLVTLYINNNRASILSSRGSMNILRIPTQKGSYFLSFGSPFSRYIILLMTKPQPIIQVPLHHTEQPPEPPEDQLRFISNYSSLERMANKANRLKILPQTFTRKQSMQIAGWITSSARQVSSSGSPRKNRNKFNRIEAQSQVGAMMTLVSDGQTSQRTTARIRARSQQQKIDKALRETNFKYGIHSPLFSAK